MKPIEASVPMPWQLAGVDPKTPVLLALSGGADSRFLLHVLSKGAGRDGFPLLLAHVHHGIRGETADRDCTFCKSLADRYGFPIEVLHADVPALAKEHGRGLEEEARAVRYAFFARLMRERKIPLLATAHQADDLLETMLFRMARGTGGGGLCAIPAVRRTAEGWLVRPMLGLTAAEIRDACRRESLDFTEDETNLDGSYARNRIRHEVIPVLESLYPAPQKQAAQLSARLGTDEDYFQGIVDSFFASNPADAPLSCATLAELHPAIRSRVFAAWLSRAGVTADSALQSRLNDLLNGANGRRVSVSRSLSAVRRRDRISLEISAPALPPYRVPLVVGATRLPCGLTVHVRIGENDAEFPKIHNLSIGNDLKISISSAIMEQNCFWRGREPGDNIRLRGHHHRLRRLWQSVGVPDALRDRLPVLCNAHGIVWAPFIGFADGGGE